jgi:S-DNA-T family DNA segregation ATPase FtsK/SpoIIIE
LAANTKNKRRAKNQPPRETSAQRQAKKRRLEQTAAIILFTTGIFFFLLVLVKGSAGWFLARRILLGLFGPAAFFIGPLLIYISLMASFERIADDLALRAWLTLAFVLALSAACQIFLRPEMEKEGAGVLAVLRQLFVQGAQLEGGGIAAAVLGLPLALLGSPGDAIAILLILFLLFMIITRSTVAGIVRALRRPVEIIADVRQPQNEKQPASPRGKSRSTQIDLPLTDGEQRPKPPLPDTASKQRLLEVIESAAAEPASPELDIAEIIAARQRHAEQDSRHPAPKTSLPEPNTLAVADSAPVPPKSGETYAPGEQLSGQLALEEDAGASPGDKAPEKPAAVYELPPLSLLRQKSSESLADDAQEMQKVAGRLLSALADFGVEARIVGINRGPTVTCYEIQLAAGIKISKVTGLSEDIALNLAVPSVRIAPVPNKMAVGIEVPNRLVAAVYLSEILDSPKYKDSPGRLTVALGRGIAGDIKTADISKMPHMLIAGATGSGKSVCINSIIMSLLFKASPDELKLLMVDPKVVELGIYNGLPHLVSPVVNDPKKAAGVLGWAVAEMNRRYELIAGAGARDINAYNRRVKSQGEEQMARIVIIIDELADLMMVAPAEVEDYICRLAQKARAAGIHLVVATQRPSVDVITGVIKANIPSRIAFAVASQVDSRTILDMGGAEKLLGAGDMLFSPTGSAKPVRLQGCFVSDDEIEKVTDYIKNMQANLYDQQVIDEIERLTPTGKSASLFPGADKNEEDSMLYDAIECVVEAGQASTSLLQRKCKLGYARAARIIDELELRGIVGPFEGSKPRQVLISRERWLEMKMNIQDAASAD